MSNLQQNLPEKFLNHFAKPPVSVLGVTRDVSLWKAGLAARGVDSTISNSPEKIFSFSKEKGYDALFLHFSLVLCQPLKVFLSHVRDLLKTNGTVFICDQLVSTNFKAATFDCCHINEVITALYENAFVVSVHEDASQQMENGPKSLIIRFHMIFGRKSDLFLRPYQTGDENTILPVFRKVFKAQRSMAHWRWKFRDNPFGAYKIAQAVSKHGDLAGHYSGYPVPFYTSSGSEKFFLSYQIGDIMTLPGFRRFGLGKTSVLGRITDYFHHKFCVDQIPFLYGFVGGSHRKFGERFLNYQYLSDIPYYVKQLDDTTLKNTWIKPKLWGVRIAKIHHIGPEFDDFFQRASRNYGMLVKRDAQYLKWRYVDCPEKVHHIFALKRFGKLTCWSVFRKRGFTLIWGDALFQQKDLSAAQMLLAHVLKAFPDVQRIETWFSKAPRWWTDILLHLQFKPVSEPNGLVAGVTIFDQSFSLKSLNQQLYYTMGDSDLF